MENVDEQFLCIIENKQFEMYARQRNEREGVYKISERKGLAASKGSSKTLNQIKTNQEEDSAFYELRQDISLFYSSLFFIQVILQFDKGHGWTHSQPGKCILRATLPATLYLDYFTLQAARPELGLE